MGPPRPIGSQLLRNVAKQGEGGFNRVQSQCSSILLVLHAGNNARGDNPRSFSTWFHDYRPALRSPNGFNLPTASNSFRETWRRRDAAYRFALSYLNFYVVPTSVVRLQMIGSGLAFNSNYLVIIFNHDLFNNYTNYNLFDDYLNYNILDNYNLFDNHL